MRSVGSAQTFARGVRKLPSERNEQDATYPDITSGTASHPLLKRSTSSPIRAAAHLRPFGLTRRCERPNGGHRKYGIRRDRLAYRIHPGLPSGRAHHRPGPAPGGLEIHSQRSLGLSVAETQMTVPLSLPRGNLIGGNGFPGSIGSPGRAGRHSRNCRNDTPAGRLPVAICRVPAGAALMIWLAGDHVLTARSKR